MMEAGFNQQNIKVSNRALVLKYLCLNDDLTRIKIAELTGLTKPSVSNIISEMMEKGLVCECPSKTPTSMRGRRPVVLKLVDDVMYSAGVCIVREGVKGILFDITGRVIHRVYKELGPTENNDTFVANIIDVLEEVISYATDRGRLLGIGVAVVGPVDTVSGIILDPPEFYGINHVPIAQILQDRFDLPVIVEHDVTAAAMAEKYYGRAKKYDTFVYMGVGSGVSCGIYVNGELNTGVNGFTGEIGHSTIDFNGPPCACGNNGCLELYVSTSKLCSKAKEDVKNGMVTVLRDKPINWETMVRAMNEGDGYANSVLYNMLSCLSASVITIMNIFDPQAIIFGSDIALVGERVVKILAAIIGERPFCSKHTSVALELAGLEDMSPVIGSAVIIFNAVFHSELGW